MRQIQNQGDFIFENAFSKHARVIVRWPRSWMSVRLAWKMVKDNVKGVESDDFLFQNVCSHLDKRTAKFLPENIGFILEPYHLRA